MPTEVFHGTCSPSIDSRLMVTNEHSAVENCKTVLNNVADNKWRQDRECDKMDSSLRITGSA
ncbi:hypothetical protein DPMN_012220 [Dreissena polymorpha]|uniref:Uncharacterized protein n=1 Tax=Dreissena polymorpha TaxID=45954 RepID=A0A9D4N5K3_DREPO|nr:hypothetical protein DPMN_012220 [Dreissena polymorpha]